LQTLDSSELFEALNPVKEAVQKAVTFLEDVFHLKKEGLTPEVRNALNAAAMKLNSALIELIQTASAHPTIEQQT
jgi:hypothetical protein